MVDRLGLNQLAKSNMIFINVKCEARKENKWTEISITINNID